MPGIISPISDFLHDLFLKCGAESSGEVATYIPELAKANSDWFGICLVAANGSVCEVGDTQQEFTIQSISKPFIHSLALEDNGREATLERVGVEPTGEASTPSASIPAPDGRTTR